MEKFWASLIIIPIFTWYSFQAVLDRDFKIKQQAVENIVYQYTQIAAKKGALYDSVYMELEKRLSRYGVFEITLSAERYGSAGSTPEVITGSEVINRQLRSEGYDIINIYAECYNEHPLGRLYELTPFGSRSGVEADIRHFAKASVYIQ